MSAGGRRTLWICRSVSGEGYRWSTDGRARFAARRAAEVVGGRSTAVLDLPLIERRSLSVVDRRRVPFLLAQERNQRRARGASPLRPQRRLRLACGQSRRRPATDQRTSLQHPASRRAAGAMPLPVSLRNRIGRAPGEARPLLRGAQRPRGGGKLRGFAAHARRTRERPERALFSAVWFWRAIRQQDCWVQRHQPSTCGWLGVSGGGILKGGRALRPHLLQVSPP